MENLIVTDSGKDLIELARSLTAIDFMRSVFSDDVLTLSENPECISFTVNNIDKDLLPKEISRGVDLFDDDVIESFKNDDVVSKFFYEFAECLGQDISKFDDKHLTMSVMMVLSVIQLKGVDFYLDNDPKVCSAQLLESDRKKFFKDNTLPAATIRPSRQVVNFILEHLKREYPNYIVPDHVSSTLEESLNIN